MLRLIEHFCVPCFLFVVYLIVANFYFVHMSDLS